MLWRGKAGMNIPHTAPSAKITPILAATPAPRRAIFDEGELLLPPITMSDIPSGCNIGYFMSLAALRFTTPAGIIAVFLHDLDQNELSLILKEQRREAEAQLGKNYAPRVLFGKLL